MVLTTSWGRSPRTSASYPWTRHEVSRGLDVGAKRCPVSELVGILRGICQGVSVTRSISSGNQVWVGQYCATSRICSSSSLILHNVCAILLTGGNAYLRRPRGQLCAVHACRVFLRSGSKTTGSETSLGTQTICASLKRLQIS